jgi:uncharacterized membrane protein
MLCISTKPGRNGTKEATEGLLTLRKVVLDPTTKPISASNKRIKSPSESAQQKKTPTEYPL